MKKKVGLLQAFLAFVFTSCAVITVNIYIPEKDVKEAYKNLENELMNKDGKPEGGRPVSEEKPQSSIKFDFITPAYADGGEADRISELVKKMPEVVAAYKEMGARIADIDRLRDSGAAGEANNGLLVQRERALSPAETGAVERENANRKTVINGMAKAIIRLNRSPETPENLRQIMPQATDQFAALRRDSAKRGWWIQDANGNWSRK